MFPPKPLSCRHFCADAVPCELIGFASACSAGQAVRAGCGPKPTNLQNPVRYPSFPLRSGPFLAGSHPFSDGRVVADTLARAEFTFEAVRIGIESRAITTTIRGSFQCAEPLSSLPFLPSRCRPACRTRRRAALPVRPPVRWSPMRWTKTWSLVPPLARLPGLQPAESSWACRPASRATDLNRACGRDHLNHGVVRAYRPVGPFSFVSRPVGRAV